MLCDAFDVRSSSVRAPETGGFGKLAYSNLHEIAATSWSMQQLGCFIIMCLKKEARCYMDPIAAMVVRLQTRRIQCQIKDFPFFSSFFFGQLIFASCPGPYPV